MNKSKNRNIHIVLCIYSVIVKTIVFSLLNSVIIISLCHLGYKGTSIQEETGTVSMRNFKDD